MLPAPIRRPHRSETINSAHKEKGALATREARLALCDGVCQADSSSASRISPSTATLRLLKKMTNGSNPTPAGKFPCSVPCLSGEVQIVRLENS